MAEVASLYNTLPTLGEADEQFVNREATLCALATLLAQYEYAFGLCLVHTHCKLAEGEIMLARGNVSEPELMEHAPTFYPERWLSTGEPYEFTLRRTGKPPTKLVDEFQRIVKDAKLQDILGLYHIDGGGEMPAIIEWTEGRKNLTREIAADDKTGEPIQTAWDFARGDPVTMSCAIYCDQRTTRGASTHKGTRSHV
ncbi:uncharacterized protein BBA_05793 [Beauveria bassiana ARSEF 2860]|uniref:Uncharacterized protein n=1 Tax=Beauveria bassiana (strain ARSEF 2860) TaxID=655819 RepID=J4ULL1_BEAB2|nr:uncharacterized protein BBA_05793 [Beauveria bassiana ARSEF 2860]EJP65462.1 hypothetical protein BBA_05793 [Beauveria bassiana ARSEF 2860]